MWLVDKLQYNVYIIHSVVMYCNKEKALMSIVVLAFIFWVKLLKGKYVSLPFFRPGKTEGSGALYGKLRLQAVDVASEKMRDLKKFHVY